MKYISEKSCIFKILRQNISDVMNTDIPAAILPLSICAARNRGPFSPWLVASSHLLAFA